MNLTRIYPPDRFRMSVCELDQVFDLPHPRPPGGAIPMSVLRAGAQDVRVWESDLASIPWRYGPEQPPFSTRPEVAGVTGLFPDLAAAYTGVCGEDPRAGCVWADDLIRLVLRAGTAAVRWTEYEHLRHRGTFAVGWWPENPRRGDTCWFPAVETWFRWLWDGDRYRWIAHRHPPPGWIGSYETEEKALKSAAIGDLRARMDQHLAWISATFRLRAVVRLNRPLILVDAVLACPDRALSALAAVPGCEMVGDLLRSGEAGRMRALMPGGSEAKRAFGRKVLVG